MNPVQRVGTFVRDLVASPRAATQHVVPDTGTLHRANPYLAVKQLADIKLPRTGSTNSNVPPILKGR